jgi:large subunit ribosomal protein L1
MSKTTQENKAKKAKLAVEEIPSRPEEKTEETENKEVLADEATKVAKVARTHGKKYLAAKKLIDINKFYPLSEAIELIKKTSLSKFDGKVEAHVTVLDIGNCGEITFPHLETAAKKVVITNDTVLADIKAGKIDFDILIATPITMPKLLPFARTLGPKGLMPNPKNGTLTDKPEEAAKKLSTAKTVVATEKKTPVVHQIVGKVSQKETELIANVNELIKVITPAKIKKLSLCATMGPSIKVVVEK